jgi:6-pyruvoyltetrahydropterin/6-carboxytetrahydropterin synthase
MLIYKEFTFEAAHFLPSAEKGTPNSRIHGHSFRVRVTLKGAPDDDTGLILHLGTVEEKLKTVQGKLDHRFLNEDVPGLELPTLEHIALWIWGELHHELPLIYEVSVMRDSCGEGCIYRGSQHKKIST